MIYAQQPSNFSPRFTIVSCFVEYNGTILLLHRQDNKPESNTWGVPAGKAEPQENLSDAIIRELQEETGITLVEPPSYITKLFVSYPTYEFIYHIFHLSLPNLPKILINPKEHKEYRWISPLDALDGTIPLIGELDNCIRYVYFDNTTEETEIA